MLEEIINLLKDGKVKSIPEIAEQLHIAADEVRIKLEYLEQAGYVKKIPLDQNTCSKKCESCKGCSLSLLKTNLENFSMWEVKND